MYKLAQKSDVSQILTYLERDLKNCLYSYIDLKKFGIGNPNLKVYFDESDGICCTALKYYEGLQLFDADGKMIIYDGPVNGYIYINGSQQKAYQLIQHNGDFYFISDYHKYIINKSQYLSKERLEGTGYPAGSGAWPAWSRCW